MNSFHFSPVFPIYWLLPVAAVLMLLLGWQESRRPYRFRLLRVAAQVAAILALLGMLLRPSREVSAERAGLIVLTENYSKQALDSLLKKEPGLKVVSVKVDSASSLTPFSAEGEGRVPTGVEVGLLGSYRELTGKGVVRYVLGDGIPTPYLETVHDSFHFLPGRAAAGVVELTTSTFPEHRKNRLNGKVRGSKGSRLTLKGPGGVEDSVTIRTNALSSFELGFKTKVPGHYLYTLTLQDSAGRRTTEEVPIEVISSRKLSILLLQAYPQAEVRFLKNYLTEKGHRVVTRYQLSRNVFRYEVANEAVKPSGALDAGELEAFDLVIGDDASIESLSGVETPELEVAVRQGLGLLVLLNGLPDGRRFPGDVLQLTSVAAAPDTVRYSLVSFGNFAGPFVAAKAGSRVQVIIRSGNYLLQGLALHGSGKVAVQTLRETYRLALGGDNDAFAALWTPLLEQSARREEGSHRLRITTPFPLYPGDPVDFDLIGPAVKVSFGGVTIPSAEDVTIDDLWHGRFWVGEVGWNRLAVGDEEAHHFFVSKPGSWTGLSVEEQRKQNEWAVSSDNTHVSSSLQKPINPLLFFLVFLMAMGFVWLSPKL